MQHFFLYFAEFFFLKLAVKLSWDLATVKMAEIKLAVYARAQNGAATLCTVLGPGGEPNRPRWTVWSSPRGWLAAGPVRSLHINLHYFYYWPSTEWYVPWPFEHGVLIICDIVTASFATLQICTSRSSELTKINIRSICIAVYCLVRSVRSCWNQTRVCSVGGGWHTNVSSCPNVYSVSIDV